MTPFLDLILVMGLPPQKKKINLQSGTIHVAYIFFKKRWSSFDWQIKIRQIPETLQAQVCQYHRWQDRQACLLGKLLIRNALIHLGKGSDTLHNLKYTKYGRPYINWEIDFNISHSGRYIVCASADCCRVGIDIEKVKPLSLSDFRNEFSLKEHGIIEKANDPMMSFYEHWTAKEAVIKADGRGMQIPLKDVNIGSNRAYLYDKVYYLKRIKLGNAYCCCVAFDQELSRLNIYDAGIDL